MKKKAFLALALAFTMCLGSTVVVAAPSPTAEDTTILETKVEVSVELGTTGALDLQVLASANQEIRNIVAQIYKTAMAAGTATSLDGTEFTVGDDATPLGANQEPELLAAFDFTPSTALLEKIAKDGKATAEFAVADVAKGDIVRILHFVEAKNEWEVIVPTSVEDGKIVAEFTSFSPIVITKLPAEVAKLDASYAPKSSSSVVYYIIAGALILAAVAIAGVSVFGNKKPEKTKR